MITDKQATDWLAAVLKGHCPQWPGQADPKAEETLWRVGAHHGVLALCQQAITNCDPDLINIPPAFKQKIKDYTLQMAATEMLVKKEISHVLSLFAEHRIESLLLKGAPLAYSIYPQPYLRSRCDTDLLFPDREEAERAADLLVAHGYKRPVTKKGDDASSEFVCFKPDKMGITHNMDMHWRVNNNWVFARSLPYDELAEAAVTVENLGQSVRTLSLPHALILCCLHRLAHKPYGDENRLIWLYDIHLICETFDGAGWRQFAGMAIKKRVCGICMDGLNQSRRYFDTAIPQEIEAEMEGHAGKEFFTGATSDNWVSMAVANLLALPDWKTRRLFLKEHLLPDTDYMLNKYNTGNRYLLPLLYMRRITAGLLKKKK